MVPWSAKVRLVSRASLTLVVLLAPGSGRAQAPVQRPVLGEGAATIDAPIPGRSVTPGQDSFLYPSPVVPGVGGSMVPRPLRPLSPPAPLRPLRRTPSAGTWPTETTYPGSANASPSPLQGGRVLRLWVNRPERGYSHAIVVSRQGIRYHWIWWPSLKGYFYLFDPAGAKYLGAYDREARVYRPLDAVTRRWGKAIALPVPVPSGPPAPLGSPGSGDPDPAAARASGGFPAATGPGRVPSTGGHGGFAEVRAVTSCPSGQPKPVASHRDRSQAGEIRKIDQVGALARR
jgi:hypothetical protein